METVGSKWWEAAFWDLGIRKHMSRAYGIRPDIDQLALNRPDRDASAGKEGSAHL